MDDLPDEILLEMLYNLQAVDLFNLIKTSRRYEDIITKENRLWYKLFREDIYPLDFDRNQNYYRLYLKYLPLKEVLKRNSPFEDQESFHKALIDAVSSNDSVFLSFLFEFGGEELIENIRNLNVPYSFNKYELLTLACKRGDLEIVKMILQELGEFDLTRENPLYDSKYPLFYAILENRIDVVDFLFKLGAEFITRRDNRNPIVASFVSPEMFDLVMSHDPDLFKPLFFIENMYYTLSLKKTPEIFFSFIPLTVTLHLSDSSYFDKLLDHYKVEDMSPYDMMIQNGNRSIVSLVYEAATCQDRYFFNKLEKIRPNIFNWANVAVVILNNIPPLNSYIREEEKIVKFVTKAIDAGLDPNIFVKSYNNMYFLQVLIERGNFVLTKLLLSRGANPNIRYKNGNYPLGSTEDERLVRLLLWYGADPHLPVINGHNLLEHYLLNRQLNLVEILTKEHEFLVWGEHPLVYAIKNNDIDLIKILIKNGHGHSDIRDKMGFTLEELVHEGPEKKRILEILRKLT